MIEKDLGQIIPDITATATIDNTEGVPSVSVTVDELNELNRLVRKFNFAFLHLKGEKGDKPVKGIDYLTEEEKQQFTTETLGLVTAEGNKQIEAVGNKGTEQAGKVTSEGSKQITLVSGEANKVITQLKELIAGNPDTSNAQALSGKSRIEFERDTQALAGKYAGNFPLTSAVKDGVYLVPATGKFYVCTQAYNGSNLTAPNANFEEMSVWANRDKLGNLFEIGEFNFGNKPSLGSTQTIKFKKEFKKIPVVIIGPTKHSIDVNFYTNVSLIKVTTSSFEVKLTNISSSYTPFFEYFAIT